MVYTEYIFTFKNSDIYSEIFMAELAQLGFEAFEEKSDGFSAFSNKNIDFETYLKKYNQQYTVVLRKIPEENWNTSWEKHIQPLEIDDQIYIKTSFHPNKHFPIVVQIDPKMSFGTGHHETTYLMIKQLMLMDLNHKSLLDMGAGTGVLSIIAKHFGASPIFAVDHDKWAYENMLENFAKNKVPQIKSFLGDAHVLNAFPKFDVVLANINRNILLRDMNLYINKLHKNGVLIMSGFYTEDIPMIVVEASKFGMVFEGQIEKNNWVSLYFVMKNDEN